MLDIKLKSNKKNIIMVIIMTILIASIGMVLSYTNIKSDSKKYGYNIYEENDEISNSILESIYGLYYKIYDENDEKKIRAADFMLELKPGTDTIHEEVKKSGRESFDEDIDSYNYDLNSNLKNLEYYALNKEHNKSTQSMNGSLNLLAQPINDKSINDKLKNKYDFYMVVDFDDKGNMKVENVYGADKKIMQSDLYERQKEGLFSYEISEIYDLKPIKNMKYVYGVPKDLKYSDSISNYKRIEESYAYSKAAKLFINIAVIFVILVAIVIPYKELKEMKLFKSLFKLPIEVIGIAVYLAFVYIYNASDDLIIKTVNNEPIISFVQMQLTQDISNIINYLSNVIYWAILFSIIFIGVIVLKHIIKNNPVKYLKENSLTYKSFKIINKKWKLARKWLFDIKLGKENSKKIKTLLIINLIVVGIICGFWFLGLIILPIYTIVLYIIIKKKYLSVNRDYNKLLDLTKDIANGKLDTKTDEDLGTFNVMKNEIENIQRGFKKAVDEEVKSQKMKTELISNVSHDLKTPLTSIITYVDLLKDENLSEEKCLMYIDTLERKSERLRVLIEDLFEVSKANSGDVSLNIMDVDVVSLMKQTLLEVDDKIKASNLKLKNNFPDEKVILKLDSQRMFRVFENLLINISKYAMDSSRVYIDIINKKECVTISFKNMTAEEIDFNVDELVERFVRGDKARNTDGSGLGLAIAKSFVELQGGGFEISTDGDLFKVVITFNK